MSRKRMFALAARFAVLAVLFVATVGMDAVGCLDDIITPPDNSGCDFENKPAIRLTVTNEDGDILNGFFVSATRGSQSATTVCESSCQNFPIGVNMFGTFNLTIRRGGYVQAQRQVAVGTNDNCNPITQNVIVVLSEDDTVASLFGAWRAETLYGRIDLRFGEEGEIIGAILYDRTIAGDGNFYVSYNNRPIRGVAGQDIAAIAANDPTRNGDVFTFVADTLGVPVGFQDALMTASFDSLTGAQPGAMGFTVTYERLDAVPVPLQDP